MLYQETKSVKVNSVLLFVYVEAALILSTGFVYFIAASNAYADFTENVQDGLTSELPENQAETLLFSIAAVGYVVIFAWVIIKKLKHKLPYIIALVGSTVLITIYIASRTVGVPIVGVEYYVGKIDIVSKILQLCVIAVGAYLLYSIGKVKVRAIAK